MSSTSRVALLCSVLAAFAVSACDKVPLLAPTNTTIRLATGIGVLPVGGTTEVTAIVIESAGTPVQNGTVVTFTSSLGTMEPREARTQNGQATVRFVAGTQSGAAKIGAFSGGAKSEDVDILVGAAAAGAVTVSAEPAFVPSTGSTVRIIAHVIDKGGNPLPGVSVGFAATAGVLSQSTALTNAAGDATVELGTNVQTNVVVTVGGSETVLSATVTVGARDLPSLTIALASPSATTEVGLPVVFSLTPSASSGAGIRSARIDFGDGNSRDLGAVPAAITAAHTYQRAGTFVVTSYATDAFGFTGTTTYAVVVTDRSTVGVQLQVLSNLAGFVTLSASITGTVSGSIRFYEWDFGDNRFETTTGPQVSHRYGAGVWTVRLRVVTTTGQEGFTSMTFRVV